MYKQKQQNIDKILVGKSRPNKLQYDNYKQ